MNRLAIVWMVFAGWLGAAASLHAGNTCIWNGSWVTTPANTDDVIVVSSGVSLMWSNTYPRTVASWTQAETYAGTATFTTVYQAGGFTNFTIMGNAIIAGGVWTHLANTVGETNRLCVTVAGNLTVTNATISANTLGYAAGKGPGKSVAYDGAGHGGTSARAGGLTYGSIIAPTNLGSGSTSVSGGGAIMLTVAGTTTVATAGTISANGKTDTNVGGGAGGSLFLTTGWLAGSGVLTALGGNGSIGQGGAGGGGRVAVILTGAGAGFGSWFGSHTAYGGTGNDHAPAGTVYLRNTAGESTLIVDNNGTTVAYDAATTRMSDGVNLNSFTSIVINHKGTLGVKSDTVLDLGALNMSGITNGSANACITIHGDATVTYPSDWTIVGYTVRGDGISKTLTNMTISNGGVLAHSANVRINSELYSLNVTLAGNLTVLSNGAINADFKGYSAGYGPGYRSVTYGGAAHGGLTSIGGGGTYGSILSPTNSGSGGAAGAGGGVLMLTVAGTTTVAAAATISANGGLGVNSGGGAGGSLFLTTGWLSGNGVLRAQGGDGGAGQGGAGGGGRLAVILTGAGSDFSTWGGSNTVYGGQGANKAAAGTLYKRTSEEAVGVGTVSVNNGDIITNVSFTCLPAFTNSTENLSKTKWTLQNKGKVGLLTNAAIWSLTLNTNSYLEVAGYTLTTAYLTITNGVCRPGVYTAAELGGLVSDNSGGNGRVIVTGDRRGTCLIVR